MDPDPSSPPGDDSAVQWLVHCSPGRTLVARRRGTTTLLVKIFEQGSVLDAEQEAELARTLAQPGVVRYQTAGQDPVTGKPCVTMDYCDGENLERQVADSGPLPASRAAELALQLSRVLADFHGTPRPGAPHGVVHRDVKPANVMWSRDEAGAVQVVLMDLEHATPRRAPPRPGEVPSSLGFTGGTHGYSPPESYIGSYPHPGFDVYALGTTLFFLLAGCTAFPQRDAVETAEFVRAGRARRHLLRGQPKTLIDLVDACLAIEETRRPTATEVADILTDFLAATLENDAAASQDRCLQAIQAAGFATAQQFLAKAEADPNHDPLRQAALFDRATKRARLLARIGGAPDLPVPDPDTSQLDAADLERVARTVADGLPRLACFLQRFPLHAAALADRKNLARTGHSVLEHVLPRVATLKMGGHFTAARDLLASAGGVAATIAKVPGGLSLPVEDPGTLPGPLLRNPSQLLERSLRDIENTERNHADLIARLEAAEANLDLDRVSQVVDEIAGIYGGASEVAARVKDRLHRLDFYLQRIAAPQRLLDQVQELLELYRHPHHLGDFRDFGNLCAKQAAATGTGSAGGAASVRAKGGVRALLDTMHQMVEDFPHTQPTIANAELALRDAMETMTVQAWKSLDEAARKLDAVPIPIRPVQKLLNRLDGIRMLETLVDLHDRSRQRLQDSIERVRMRLDQARTARDNIARGAQEAMEKGHLTTALYDMARAVDRFEDESEPGDQLSRRLEEARRRKKELGRATVENHRLAARYVELLEDDDSLPSQRIAVLEERAIVLERLIRAFGEERAAHYRTDLRELRVRLTEHRDVGVSTDATTQPRDSHTGRRLWHSTPIRIAASFVLIATGFGVWQVVYGKSTPPKLAFAAPGYRIQSKNDALDYPAARAAAVLANYTDSLRGAALADHEELRELDLTAIAGGLSDLVRTLVPATSRATQRWCERFKTRLSNLDTALATLEQRVWDDTEWDGFRQALRTFGRSAHRAGLSLVVLRSKDATLLDATIDSLRSLRRLALEPQENALLHRLASDR